MEPHIIQYTDRIISSTLCQITVFILTITLLGNLNAIVDFFLHPDIPYFDKEHLIVGGVTGFVSAVLFGLLLTYVHHLNKALKTIKRLESILPICCNCKKIRKPNSDPKIMDSWQQIDAYITQKTTTTFSHGLCPECFLKLYPEFGESQG